MKKLDELVKRIVEVANPERIVLFGSRARGDNRPDSDFDFLVIQKSDLPRYRRAVPIRRAVTGFFPSKDIVVYKQQGSSLDMSQLCLNHKDEPSQDLTPA